MAAEIVVVGTSRGGLKAMETLLQGLGHDFAVPIVVVQHRSKEMETGLCDYLRRLSPLPVSEPDDKEPILPAHVYLAPRDYHLLIDNQGFALSTDAPVGFARPSIDVLFESAAAVYGDKVVGVVLTGSNRDGARGIEVIKAHGGLTIVEDPETATHAEMPLAALASVEPHWILPLAEIATRLRTLSNGGEYVH